MKTSIPRITSFDLQPGRVIAGKYCVLSRLGSGWEGEVYRVVEIRTGIERAAKLFYPQRNIKNRASKRYAKKLHKLRHCPILIQYHTEELVTVRRSAITVLISEYVEGRLLSAFLESLPRKRLSPFEALHLLCALAKGMEQVHLSGEYHGDLHVDNVIVSRHGLEFQLKLLDLFQLDASKAESRQSDICDVIRLFHESLGGAKHYAKQPRAIKYICSGLKTTLILQKFRTMSQLCKHIEMMEW
jgi:serine/threonine protein kinase